jgi:hypothetical protein
VNAPALWTAWPRSLPGWKRSRLCRTRGLSARLDVPPSRLPSLVCPQPEPRAAGLSEHIYTQPRTDSSGGIGSEWTYWWPWAGPIVDDLAAAVITGALRVTSAR